MCKEIEAEKLWAMFWESRWPTGWLQKWYGNTPSVLASLVSQVVMEGTGKF